MVTVDPAVGTDPPQVVGSDHSTLWPKTGRVATNSRKRETALETNREEGVCMLHFGKASFESRGEH